jgi:hypothetical protein
MSAKQKRKTKGEIAELAETTQKLSEHRKTIELKNGDRVEIRYIPCPAEKISAWRLSMRIITALLLEILESEVLDGLCFHAPTLSQENDQGGGQ